MTFIFDRYEFNSETFEAAFFYAFSDGHSFCERVQFQQGSEYDEQVLDRALRLAFLVAGTSYCKAFPVRDITFRNNAIDEWQADFLNTVYQEGLSQYAFENGLTRQDLALFQATGESQDAIPYSGDGVVSLQSGGKDSLLVASLLTENDTPFTPLYIASGPAYPAVLDGLSEPLCVVQRRIDREALHQVQVEGARNGHVPVTYIVQAIALVQAVLLGKNTVLAAIGHEGEEPHEWIDDLPVNHQWSKTWPAEQLFAAYVEQYISPDIRIGSPLRQYSELKVTQLFAAHTWAKFGHSFSSCNQANYGQGRDNTILTWCGVCPKCANSYLLFAPFIDKTELDGLFGGKSLLADLALTETFKGLLGIDGVMKPFECVGETDELRLAYHLAVKRGYEELPFIVPESSFDIEQLYPAQAWTKTYVD